MERLRIMLLLISLSYIIEVIADPTRAVGRAGCKKSIADESLTTEFRVKLNSDVITYTFAYRTTGPETYYECDFVKSVLDGEEYLTITSIVDTKTNSDATSVNPCGFLQVFDVDRGTGYKWNVALRAASLIAQANDSDYTWTCYEEEAFSNFLPSDVLVVNANDLEGNAVRVRPENKISVLERTGVSNNFRLVTQTVSIGQDVKLRVETKVKRSNSRLTNVDRYGVYAFSCDYRTSLLGARTQFIQLNGCPNTEFSDLSTGFQFAQYATANQTYVWFQTESGAFKLAPTTPPNDYYYIGCYVRYCYGIDGTDGRCSDYCDSNSRRRRSFDDTADVDRITIAVKVNYDTPADTDTGEHAGHDGQTTIVAISLCLVISLIVVALIVVFLLCARQRSRAQMDWSDSSTVGSSRNLPAHLYQDRPKAPKF